MTEKTLQYFEKSLIELCRQYDVLIFEEKKKRTSLKDDAIYFREFTVSAKVNPKDDELIREIRETWGGKESENGDGDMSLQGIKWAMVAPPPHAEYIMR